MRRLECGECGGTSFSLKGERADSLDMWVRFFAMCGNCKSETEISIFTGMELRWVGGSDGILCAMEPEKNE